MQYIFNIAQFIYFRKTSHTRFRHFHTQYLFIQQNHRKKKSKIIQKKIQFNSKKRTPRNTRQSHSIESTSRYSITRKRIEFSMSPAYIFKTSVPIIAEFHPVSGCKQLAEKKDERRPEIKISQTPLKNGTFRSAIGQKLK